MQLCQAFSWDKKKKQHTEKTGRRQREAENCRIYNEFLSKIVVKRRVWTKESHVRNVQRDRKGQNPALKQTDSAFVNIIMCNHLPAGVGCEMLKKSDGAKVAQTVVMAHHYPLNWSL